jgi:hypothetical protein
MNTRPDLQVSVATAQTVVDRACAGRTVATVSTIHGGDIAAVYEIGLVEPQPPAILKVYPDSLHWKMQKEVTVVDLIQAITISTLVTRLPT